VPRLIRDQVLRAIAANREPGFHFAGNLLGLSFDRVEADDTHLSLDVTPHLADADGQLNLGAFAMLVDFALANSMRATLEPHQRLATVSMTLELTAAPRTGRLDAAGRVAGFIREGKGRIGKASVEVSNGSDLVCVATGAFMALDPPKGVTLYPVPHRTRNSPPIELVSDFTDEEREILRRADAALADPKPSFIERFWGLGGDVMENGPHVGNRVGHAQGGILLGLAASAANRVLPAAWRLSGLSGWYLRPGEGTPLAATSSVVHEGRLTAALRTRVKGPDGRTVIEVMTTHARQATL
jgi:acyl-coenzyme A thioesterase PaaI-like protein